MRLYCGAKTKFRVVSKLSGKYLVQVGVHKGSVLPPLLFAVVVDVIMEYVKENLMYEILYADNLVLIRESVEKMGETFLQWKGAFKSMELKLISRPN